MFLVGVSGRGPLPEIEDPRWRSRRGACEPYHYIVVSDGFLSEAETSERGFEVAETLLTPLTSRMRSDCLAHVRFDGPRGEITVHKPMLSGRPVYYHITSDGDFFCSTHVSALRKLGVPIRENDSRLPEFFVYRHVLPPATLYHDVHQLSLNESIRVSIRPGRTGIISRTTFEPPGSAGERSLHDGVRGVRMALIEATRDLEPARDQAAFLLSGGLDSSILYGLARDHLGVEDTYSTSYPATGSEDDAEKAYATTASDAFGSRHHFYAPSVSEFQRAFVNAVAAAEEPLHHLQSILLHRLFEVGLPPGRSIVVSGQGADGVFGLGFHDTVYRVARRRQLLAAFATPFLAPLPGLVASWSGRGEVLLGDIALRKAMSWPVDDPRHAIYSLGRFGSEPWVRSHFGATPEDIVAGRREFVCAHRQRSIYDLITGLDLVGDVAVSQSLWSKLAESSRRRVYYPFNHPGVLDSAAPVAWPDKLRRSKSILRGVARGIGVPAFIVERPKLGFGLRSSLWTSPGGLFEPFVPLAAEVFDPDLIWRLRCDDGAGAMTFWNMLNYAIWRKVCIEGEPVQIAIECGEDVQWGP